MLMLWLAALTALSAEEAAEPPRAGVPVILKLKDGTEDRGELAAPVTLKTSRGPLCLPARAISALRISPLREEDVRGADAKARALLVRLGDDAFEVREKAQKDLAALGSVCRGVLESERANPDPEIAVRVAVLLEALGEAGATQAPVDRAEGAAFHLKGWIQEETLLLAAGGKVRRIPIGEIVSLASVRPAPPLEGAPFRILFQDGDVLPASWPVGLVLMTADGAETVLSQEGLDFVDLTRKPHRVRLGEKVLEGELKTGRIDLQTPFGPVTALSAEVRMISRQGVFRVGDVLPGGQEVAAVKRFQGHTYLLVLGWVNWKEATALAAGIGGHLVTIASKEENALVTSLKPEKGEAPHAIIGCDDTKEEGRWAWCTGEAFGFTSWNGGEPNNSSLSADGEDACVMHGAGAGRWNDISVSSPVASCVVELEY